VKTISSYLDCRTFQTSFQTATSTCRGMQAGVVQGGLVSPLLFSLYVNDIPTPSRHVELAQYAEDTALAATSRSPSLLVGYLEAWLGRLERWLRDWRIAINVSKSTAVLFLRPRDASKSPEQCSFSESQYCGSKQCGILGWPWIPSLPGRRTSTRWERRQLKDWACLASSLTGEAACPSETVCCSTSSSCVL
jgi:hypothetical protein